MINSIWSEALLLLQHSIDSVRFETWIKPLIPIESEDNNCITLSAKNKFIVDFLKQHYNSLILSFIQKISPKIQEIKFVCSLESSISNNINNNIEPETSSFTKHNSLNPQYIFDLFVSGSGNEFAKNASFAVAENPGKTKFNPLFIYGGSGLGKTHLLHAIGNYIIKINPGFNVSYVTAEEFYYGFIEAIKNSNTKSFVEKYQKSDILLIDDIQFIAGKERTQEKFFYLFNTLYQKSTQIVLTSDLAPNALKGLHDRLISRFQWGLCVDIQPPDLETRVAILKKKAERDNLTIPENILYYIAENISSNIRKLEGIIIKILAFSSITKTDITLSVVKNILGTNNKRENSKLTIDDIIQKVSEYYKIPVNNIREKKRSKEVALCRQVAMYIAKCSTNYSLKTIGLHFGGRDHSTVIHAIKLIDKNKKKDDILNTDINNLLSLLEE